MRPATHLGLTLGLTLGLAANTAQAAPPPTQTADDPVLVQAPQGWADELDADALASYLRPSDRAVLVIVAGEGGPQADAAKDALEQQLRAHTRGLRVAGARWGGQTSQDDQKIIASAKKSSFVPDVVMLARLFDTELVVTIYDLEGEVVDGFIVAPGRALQARSDLSEANGVTEQAFDAVAEVVDEQPTHISEDLVREEVQEAYVAQSMHFQRVPILNPWTGEISLNETDRIVRGNSSTPMSYEQALRAMGQTKLANDYQRRKASKFALVFSGAFLAVGIPVGGSMLLFSDFDESSGMRTGGGVGIAVGVTGLAMIIAGAALPKLVDKEAMRSHMNAYNGSLRTKLRRSDLSFGESVRETWSLAPAVSRNGASLAFSARF